MLERIEIYQLDPEMEWVEVEAKDQLNPEPCLIHLIIRDSEEMLANFVKRYQSKQEIVFEFSDSVLNACRQLFQELQMAQALATESGMELDNLAMMQTLRIHLRKPEWSTLRKSKAGRLHILSEEVLSAIKNRDFERAIRRLDWMHLLEPENELAFELRIVALRSSKRMRECVPVFEQWIKAHPKQWEPKLGLSELWLYLDQNQKAKEAFQNLLDQTPNQILALVGLAQAKARLGESYDKDLLKAFVIDGNLVREMVEHQFDFRRFHADDLQPCTLRKLSERYSIPLKRLIGRAQRGVLPIHVQEGLLFYSESEMERYYQLLLRLGLEIEPKNEPPENEQLSLFESS